MSEADPGYVSLGPGMGDIRTKYAWAILIGELALIPILAVCLNPILSALSKANPTTAPISPSTACLMGGRPSPSEQTYSARSFSGAIASPESSGTVFIGVSCPPNSR